MFIILLITKEGFKTVDASFEYTDAGSRKKAKRAALNWASTPGYNFEMFEVHANV